MAPLFTAWVKRSVQPNRLITFNQIASDEIASGEILVAGNGNQRSIAYTFRGEAMGHVLNETSLPTTSGALEKDRQAASISGGENLHFVTNWQVEWCLLGIVTVIRKLGSGRLIVAHRRTLIKLRP